VDSLPPLLQNQYECYFYTADEGFFHGRVAASAKTRDAHWENWVKFIKPVGVDPYLQETNYVTRVQLLTGFAAYVRSGDVGRGCQVTTSTVSMAITAVGQTIAVAVGHNPTKLAGSDKLIPRLAQTLDGWQKGDPPTAKKLPVKADVPEHLCKVGNLMGASPLEAAVGDLTLIAFYYLLRVGEYTCKGTRNSSKQTVQFKLEDVTFFHSHNGSLQQLPRNTSAELIMSAHSATLKLDNQKNGWNGICIHQEHNGEALACPVRALGRQYLHIWKHASDPRTFLSAYFDDNGARFDVTDRNVSAALKVAALLLDYPSRGFPVDRINTHSLWSGGANALSLAGYSDHQI
jgi:hypothetical protein